MHGIHRAFTYLTGKSLLDRDNNLLFNITKFNHQDLHYQQEVHATV